MAPLSTQPFWWDGSDEPAFPALEEDLTCDVLVVGAGITGLTTAALLADAGRSVAVIERERVCGGETGRTTSHMTEIVDARYSSLIEDFGQEGAALVAASQRSAIELVQTIAERYRIDCDFLRVPGYLYTEREDEVDWLVEEGTRAAQSGVKTRLTNQVPLPFRTVAGIEVPGQAQFHPLKYLRPLAEHLARSGVRIHERTQGLTFEDGEPCQVETSRGRITARDVVIAAHVPVNDRVLVHTKTVPYRSYVVATPVPHGTLPPGLFWDTGDPYNYLRLHPGGSDPLLIVGGADHRVGDSEKAEAAFRTLRTFAKARLGIDAFEWQWSGHIVESVDGLPYIGRNPMGSHVYIATGFAGNGTTFGTIAGRIIADLVLGRPNRYADLFDAGRVKPLAAGVEYVKQNVAFPMTVARDRLTNLNAEEVSPGSIARGTGQVIVVGGLKFAVARDNEGHLHVLSPVCTHMACDVEWNPIEDSWDCPCHGSRFGLDGRVLNGPAVASLEQKALPQTTG